MIKIQKLILSCFFISSSMACSAIKSTDDIAAKYFLQENTVAINFVADMIKTSIMFNIIEKLGIYHEVVVSVARNLTDDIKIDLYTDNETEIMLKILDNIENKNKSIGGYCDHKIKDFTQKIKKDFEGEGSEINKTRTTKFLYNANTDIIDRLPMSNVFNFSNPENEAIEKLNKAYLNYKNILFRDNIMTNKHTDNADVNMSTNETYDTNIPVNNAATNTSIKDESVNLSVIEKIKKGRFDLKLEKPFFHMTYGYHDYDNKKAILEENLKNENSTEKENNEDMLPAEKINDTVFKTIKVITSLYNQSNHTIPLIGKKRQSNQNPI